MCRQFIAVSMEDLDRLMNEIRARTYVNKLPDWPARPTSVFPKMSVPLLVLRECGLEPQEKTWGYPVSWSKSPIFNTRQDSIEKDIWKESVQHRRCIIPTFGFYEPHQTETTISKKTGKSLKQNYLFEMPDKGPLFIAGIYQDDHFSMMTTEPNSIMRPIHNRMPLVLRQGELKAWLQPGYERLFDRSDFELVYERVS